jgi:hypothetical protein
VEPKYGVAQVVGFVIEKLCRRTLFCKRILRVRGWQRDNAGVCVLLFLLPSVARNELMQTVM